MKKLNWDFIKSCLKVRREDKKMKALGYKMHETDWEIIRGGDYDKVIIDVKISADKKHVWTKVGLLLTAADKV